MSSQRFPDFGEESTQLLKKDKNSSFDTCQNLEELDIEESPIKITFSNLEYELNVRVSLQESWTGMRRVKIIKNATGYILPGQTLYIMGSTGSGKSTLLNMISDRIYVANGATLKRKVLINDSEPLTHVNFGKYCAFVAQDDILFNFFTPREALTFTARLRLNMSKETQDKRVNKLISDFDLESIADQQIGNVHGALLTPSQIKRTSIAESLIIDPAVLLLDEPTSGLDSIQALNLVKLLRAQSLKGKSIVCTIHQPGSEAFSFFDRLILMAEGSIVYQGYAASSPLYFNSIGLEVPAFNNPADYYMQVLSLTNGNMNDKERVDMIQQSYIDKIDEVIKQEIIKYRVEKPNKTDNRKYATWGTQFKQLLYRNYVAAVRDPRIMKAEIIMTLFTGLLSLACFWDLSGNDYASTVSLSGTLFFCSMTLFMMPFNSAIFVAIGERALFMREQSQNMYSVFFYQMCRFIVEIPILMLIPFIFACIVFFGVGLTVTGNQFFVFYITLFLSTFCGYSFGYCFSCGFIKAEAALTVSILPQIIIEQFGGYFVNSGSYPDWLNWLQYITPVRYSFEAMIRSEFQTRDFEDDEPNPIDYLEFNVGIHGCLVALLAMIAVSIVLALLILKRTALGKIQN